MPKPKKLLLFVLIVIAGVLGYCWFIILFTEIEPTWRHYLAIILFVPILILFKKDFKKAVLITGVYLILGTSNLLTLTPSVTSNSYGIRIGSVEVWTPTFQLYSFLLLILYFLTNFNSLVNYYLDYQDSKKLRQTKRSNEKS
jgi:hypothetical protein